MHSQIEDLIKLGAMASNNPFAAFCVNSSDDNSPITVYGLSSQDAHLLEPINDIVRDTGEPLIIEDILKDERTKGLPGLENGKIHHYAGFPVSLPNKIVNVFWVASNKPGKLNEKQEGVLRLTVNNIKLLLRNINRIQKLKDENSELLIQEIGAEIAEEKYRSIFENVQEGIFQSTEDGRFISANPKLAEIYGFDSTDALIAGFSNIAHDVYTEPLRREEFIRLMGENDVIHNFESKARKQDGGIIWISENVRAVRNQDAQLLYYEGTVVDITEQKHTSEALRESELLYHSLVESIPQNIVRKNLEGRFTFANQKFCQIIGKPMEKILGQTDYDLSPKDLADKYRRDDLRVIETGEPYATTEIHTGSDKEENNIYIETVKTPLRDPAGNITGIQCMFWDVTERHQIEEQLAYERDLLSALLDNVPDRIYIKDTESRFIKGSTALAKRLGLNSAEDFIGKTDYDFHPSTQAKKFHEDEQRVILTGNPIVNKVEQQTDETGREIWASVTKVPFSNRSGIITGIIGISRDITALKLAERETVRARDLALEAAQMKARFLAVMSHEIRTPMNGIIGMIDLLLTSDLSEEQKEYADTVRTSADALLDILNDILDLSKIEAGRLELEKTEFSLRKVVEEAVELHALRAEANHIELNCYIPPPLDMQYSGDAGRLRQILLNLVSNAVKFTEKGEVQASVQLLEDTEEEVRLQFTVKDSGIGIGPDMSEKVFDAFRQADGSTTRRYGGTGLGLSISKQLSEMMDGEMWVESKPGKGSQFHFTVLLKKTATPEHSYANELRGKNFLLVVPNEFARTSISSYAENIGLCVSAESSGTTARNTLNNDTSYDLILLDLNLEDTDCLDLVQEIQTNPKQSKTKIVLLTNRKHKVDSSLLRTLGISGTLLKPVRLDRLHQSLHSALTGKPHSPKPIIELDGARHGSLRILVAEDNPINQRVATLQLTKLGHRVDICEDGQAVLDSHLEDFDIILMDCQMPVLDGLEATRKLREIELSTKNTRPVYIIAMTANTQEDDRAACLEAGMDDFISKPVQLKELQTALNRSLGINPESADNNTKNPLLATAQIDQLRGNGQDDDFKEIISMYIEQTREQLGALEKAVNEKDLESIISKAHQIKGSSANLGAIQIADLCSQLEDGAKDGNISSSNQLLNEIHGTFDRTKVQLLALSEE